MLVRLILIVCIAPLILLGASHLGALHPAGDSLAVFRGVLSSISGLAVFLLLWRGQKTIAVFGAGLVLWSAYTVLSPRYSLPLTQTPPYSLYQKNMSFRMPSIEPIANDILLIRPDFITLQEVDGENRALLALLKPEYPSHAFCDFAAVGGVAIASRWPMVPKSEICIPRSGMVALQVITQDGPVWLVSLHLHWPFPYGQAAQVDTLLPRLRALTGPVVLAGDFNMVPWSHTVHSVATATRTKRVGAVQDTLPLGRGKYTLPIDHVFVSNTSKGGRLTRQPLLGSDHYGVFAQFSLN